jgi:hypothetical protein
MQLFEVKQTNVNHKDNKTRQFGEDVQPDMSSLLLSCVAGKKGFNMVTVVEQIYDGGLLNRYKLS